MLGTALESPIAASSTDEPIPHVFIVEFCLEPCQDSVLESLSNQTANEPKRLAETL